jgi:predicted ATPase
MTQYLKQIALQPSPSSEQTYPFNIPGLKPGLHIEINRPILVIAGENGVGKSTLVSAIAQRSGFNASGGNQHHYFGDDETNPLSELLTLSWQQKTRRGFYLRADRLADFQRYLNDISSDDPSIFNGYGGSKLSEHSHGESLFALYEHHFHKGLFILDEPETALSFSRQLALVSILNTLVADHDAQFIVATHSPVLMSIPNAQLFAIDHTGIHQTTLAETDIYATSKLFFDAPERFHKHL